jgi:2'-5' RNA ligase
MVPVEGLDDLAAQVRRSTVAIGKRPDHQFCGHLTLARAKGRAMGPPVGEPVSALWVPEEIEVVSSVTEAGGAVHRVLATFPIG